jgi:hypothetical protein
MPSERVKRTGLLFAKRLDRGWQRGQSSIVQRPPNGHATCGRMVGLRWWELTRNGLRVGRYRDDCDFALFRPVAPEYAVSTRRLILSIRFKYLFALVEGILK